MVDIVPTIGMFNDRRTHKSETALDKAFDAIFFNRTTFSGLLESGPIGGKNQAGKYKIDCRYMVPSLIKKIIKCNLYLKGRTTVTCLDFEQHDAWKNPDIAIVLDPPYFAMGNALYKCKMTNKDHHRLESCVRHRDKWLMTIDDCQFIRDLYSDYDIYEINVKYMINSIPKYKVELFIKKAKKDGAGN
jgi:DNA adenine methylase